MKRGFAILLLLFAGILPAQKKFQPKANVTILPKEYLFKVDPASALFNEFRCTIEKRWKIKRRERTEHRDALLTGRFIYVSPSVVQWNRFAESGGIRQFGSFLRFGVRHYFLGKYEPQGVFLQTGGVYRALKIKAFDGALEPSGRVFVHSPGGQASVGYQHMLAPKHNIVVGGHFGAEYLYPIWGTPQGNAPDVLQPAWYFWDLRPAGELRIFIALEVGFGFLQKARHW